MMKKEKLLLLLVILLVVLNAGALIFLFIQKQGPPPRQQEMFQIINERLHLDKQQLSKFEELRKLHRHEMDELDNYFKQDLNEYIKLLKAHRINIALRNSYESNMADIEKRKARATLEHFQQLKFLLKPDQLEEFYKLLPELPRVMLRGGNPPDPRRD